jgi:hypothetical protein
MDPEQAIRLAREARDLADAKGQKVMGDRARELLEELEGSA